MTKTTRSTVRQVSETGILQKRFKPVGLGPGRRKLMPVTPLAVLADLRRGVLHSLDRYLMERKGIPDREIALELRKLISGSAARSKFRIVVTLHPGAPHEKSGRPQRSPDRITKRRRQIAARYRENLEVEGKAYLARETTMAEFNVNAATVKRAVADLAALEKRRADRLAEQQANLEAVQALQQGPRERALAAMKAKYGQDDKAQKT